MTRPGSRPEDDPVIQTCLQREPGATLPAPHVADDLVEEIVRWYYLQGAAPGSAEAGWGLGQGVPGHGMLDARVLIFGTLAAVPPDLRIPAGNPYRPELTITAVERAIIAELAYEDTDRQLKGRPPQELRDGVWVPCPATLSLVRDLNLWDSMIDRYRAHSLFAPALHWLARAFGRIVYGDATIGQRPDATFLPLIHGD